MWLILTIIGVPLVEIGLFIWLGGVIGLWPTLIWVVLSGAFGLIVLKGVASLGPVSLSRDMKEMQDPLSPYAHRLLVGIGGGLLLIPGFMTDLLGVILLVPALRAIALRMISARLVRLNAGTASSQTIEGQWTVKTPGTTGTDGPADRTRH